MPSTAYATDFTRTADDIDRAERLRRLRRLAKLARIMDTAVGIPGTRFRFGADSLLGLVPIVGDASGAIIGLAIVNEARRLGVPKRKMAQMLYNLGLDATLGAVPLVGDVFDVYFKAHKRNIQLIMDHFELTDRDL
ncbi:hypothetical protein ASG25_13180 [Rhizobium sp. Leaf384]|uniref:DUF4112 domain-containing protein n=1 Tax=unclassified Rhizobium TaxID=2613769 RepID=UPI0007153AC8|nr:MULTISPECIES: DUF4112 domain-containing protein [unclassified Rhizobium]KQR69482.1 hypothetical protein ASG03_07475 [Rhizobium sp. Leaf341]KQS79631.1 hypothetical protein ASG25_13180 [Rhizobium sp. Leaf384]KQS85137.1 hypothetical protein ASG58_19870 [Rhizobium sp. Leaf383]